MIEKPYDLFSYFPDQPCVSGHCSTVGGAPPLPGCCLLDASLCVVGNSHQHQNKNSIHEISPARTGRFNNQSRLAKTRSEEHTSELQSHLNLVCRLLLEKK